MTGDVKTLDRAIGEANYASMRNGGGRRALKNRHPASVAVDYVEIRRRPPAAVPPGVGWWRAKIVRVEPSGKVTVMTGASPHGQVRKRRSRKSRANVRRRHRRCRIRRYVDRSTARHLGSRATAGRHGGLHGDRHAIAKAKKFAAIQLRI
jgi:hypothetical protein